MVVIGLGKNLLFKSVLAHCGKIIDLQKKFYEEVLFITQFKLPLDVEVAEKFSNGKIKIFGLLKNETCYYMKHIQ